MQIEFFKTTQQQGCPAFVYWQHVLQIKALSDSIKEGTLELNEIAGEIEDANSRWPYFTRKQRLRKIPRLKFRAQQIQESIDQKTRELKTHKHIIESQFYEFIDQTEEEIFAHEREYWTIRLSKQLVTSKLARQLGVSEGSLEAVLALPEDQQKEILQLMTQTTPKALLE